MNKNHKKTSVLKKYSKILFNDGIGDPKALLDIAMGRSQLTRSKVNLDSVDYAYPVDTIYNLLSFGQFIYCKMQQKDIEIVTLANELFIEVEELTDILDDVNFPWELSIELQKKIIGQLTINKSLLCEVLKRHPINEASLPKDNYDFAARSTFDMDTDEREEELNIARIKVLVNKEEKKRNAYLDKLFSEL